MKTLEQLADACGAERPASVSREISKLHEETRRGSLGELIEHFAQNTPRGEIVICVGGASAKAAERVHRNKYRDTDD